MENGSELPITVLNGRPGYINLLDAFNGWQLVRELKKATGLPAATSFKHVSPAGAAVGLPMDNVLKKIYWVDDLGELSPWPVHTPGPEEQTVCLPSATLFPFPIPATWIRRSSLKKRGFPTASLLRAHEPEALEILKAKKNGNYNVIQIDENYVPDPIERKQVFGITFEQGRNELDINKDLLSNIVTDNKEMPEAAKVDLMIALITLKVHQSNSVCYVKGSQAIGIGPASSPESTVPVSQARRQTTGSYGRLPPGFEPSVYR